MHGSDLFNERPRIVTLRPEDDPETRLLAKICTSVVRDIPDAELQGLAVDADWDKLRALAQRHRVSALVAYGLRRSGIILSSELKNALLDEERAAQHAELASVAEVRRLVHAFSQEGITTILLKGVAVSMRAFGCLGLRHNRDIDLLVCESNVDRAETILVDSGYVRVEPHAGMSRDAERRWRVSHKDSVFVHRDRLSIVELHWRLFENSHLLPMPLNVWEEPASVVLPGLSVRCLPHSFDLSYLCVHGAQHAWSRLKWLVDIDGLLSVMSVEHQILAVERARELGVIRAVEQAFFLRDEVLGCLIDPAVMALLPNDSTSRLLKRLGLRCLRDGGAIEIEEQRFATTAKNISHYWLRRDIRYWLSELWFDLTNGVEGQLPPALWWIAPVARPWIWIRKIRRRARLA